MRVAEVHLDAGVDGELHMGGHFRPLVPGQGPEQLAGQLADRLSQGGGDLVGRMPVGQVEQDHEPLRPLDQGAHDRAGVGAQDEVSESKEPAGPISACQGPEIGRQ